LAGQSQRPQTATQEFWSQLTFRKFLVVLPP
jgi:hypothetical protein